MATVIETARDFDDPESRAEIQIFLLNGELKARVTLVVDRDDGLPPTTRTVLVDLPPGITNAVKNIVSARISQMGL